MSTIARPVSNTGLMDFERAKAIFAEATALASPEARAACLDSACAGDAVLRAQIESLVAAENRLGDFLEPAFKQQSDDGAEVLGQRIGPYRILQKIGEGGFGFVYMAEQESPVRRKVALKVIKAGMDTKQVIARFEAERQALALMDHPNIARVFDGGETQAGRPYFVMELVKGIPLTEFCDQKRLRARERLELFIQVCHAVQHAHQKGIIHRDLKPSNVMITMVDGEPVPKVIDFGVAKAVEQKLTERTLFTRYDQMIGTPAYMSPEQAELSGQDVDTRSDIYSLGVLLYELLTSTPPIDADALRRAGLDELRRLIRETEPPPPSTRLQTLGDKLATVAESRRAEPATLHKTLRGDLDWIVMKCLEKDRGRRYETANGLGMDLQRFLHHEPVVARPPSNLYRCRKFVRRHRLQVAFAAGLTVAIITGLIFAWIGFARAQRERDRAIEAEKLAQSHQLTAQREASRSAQVAKFLKDMLGGASPAIAQGRDTTILRQILDKTASRLKVELAEQPEVEAELRMVLGQIYRDLDDFTIANAMYDRALELRRRGYGDPQLEVADSLHSLADLRQRQRRYAEAESLFREALAIRRQLLGERHPEIARTLSRLASVLKAEGKLAEVNELLSQAEQLTRDTLEILRANPESEPEETLRAMSQLRSTLMKLGKYAEAETVIREYLAQKSETNSLGGTLFDLSQALFYQNKFEEAEVTGREVVAIRRKAFGDAHSETAKALTYLANVLRARGQLPEAEAAVREVVAILDQTAPGSWKDFSSRIKLGGILLVEKKHVEAEPLLLAGYAGIQMRRDQSPSSYPATLKHVLQLLAQLYEETGKPAEAAKWKQKLGEFDRGGDETKAVVPGP